MKKLICLALTVCLFVSAFSLSAFAAETTTEEITLNFDYNGDGSVNLLDARTVLRVSAGIEPEREGYIYDLVGDNNGIDMNDVKKVIGIVTGIDTEVTECAEFNLALFRSELNNIKAVRPGFEKTATTHCLSMLVTTRNAPDDSLNVTNMEFDQYTNKTCDYMEDLLNGAAGILVPADKKAEMKASISQMRKKAADLYKPNIQTSTVSKRSSHYSVFPVNNLGNSCYLTIDDIASIECTEIDGNIVRTVTMNTDTYIGDEYPTGSAGASQRWKTISYGKVFNIPELSETEGGKQTSRLNSITFSEGKIVSTIDKLSGIPISVEYSYKYVADVSTIPQKEGDLEMDSVTTATISEVFDINPVINN